MSEKTIPVERGLLSGLGGPAACVPWDRLALAAAIVPFLVAYIIRVGFYVSVPADEAEWLVSTQTWRLAYEPLHPPLGVWVGRLVQLAVGGGYSTLLAVKFAVLAGFIWFVYLTARRVMGPGAAAFATAVAPMGMVFVAWEPLLSYTHSLFLLFFCSVTLYVLVRLYDRPSWLWYALLGFSLSAGILSKYFFLLFTGGLLAAALWAAPWRRLVVTPKILAPVVIVLAVCGPHFWHQAGVFDDILSADEVSVAFRDQSSFFADRLAGLGSFFEAFFSFSLPAIVLIPLWFLSVVRQAPLPDLAARAAPLRGLMWRWWVVLLGGYVLGIILFGVTYTRTHHLYFLGLATFPLMLEVFVRGASARRFVWFAGLMVALQSVAVTALIVRAYTDVETCGKCHVHMPYDKIADDLRAAGFSGGTIVSYSTPFVDIGENLMPSFPDARVFSLKWPGTYPPPIAERQACVVVWDAGRAQNMYAALTGKAIAPLLAPVPADAAHGVIERPLHRSQRLATGIGYALMPPGQRVCP